MTVQMSLVERRALQHLEPGTVRYLPGSWEKRFMRNISNHADDLAWEPSALQWEHIRRLAHRYRKQAPVAHVVLCETCTYMVLGTQAQLALHV